MNNRSGLIDALRGGGIVLVCVGHLIQYEMHPVTYDLNFLYRAIYSFHMPLFFLISGYLVVSDAFLVGVKKKFIALVLPFCFYHFVNGLVFSGGEGVDFLALLRRPQSGLWFLWVLFLIHVLFYACLSMTVVWRFVFFVAVGVAGALFGKNYAADYVVYYGLFFVIGYLAKSLQFGVSKVLIDSSFLISLVAWCFLISLWSRVPAPHSDLLGFFVLKLACAFLGSWAFLGFVRFIEQFFSRFGGLLGQVGRYTLPIYAIHFYILFLYRDVGVFVIFLLLIVPILVSKLAGRVPYLNILVSGKG